MLEIFQYGFLLRALVVGLLVSLCAALLGVSLVLKRFSMIGDGLSHVGFGALAIASALNLAPLQVSIPVVIVAAFILLRISSDGKIKGDAAIALLSSSALAIGAIVISQTNSATDMNSYMFGSIMAISNDDLALSIICSVTVIVMFVFFYNKIFAVTFDENFSKATGVKSGVYNTIIALLTALTIVVGMRIMGALLISSLIIFPALTSMRIFRSFRSVTICSAIVSCVRYSDNLLCRQFPCRRKRSSCKPRNVPHLLASRFPPPQKDPIVRANVRRTNLFLINAYKKAAHTDGFFAISCDIFVKTSS